ncbi:hypothetical protein GJ496_005018 [Pomphorhynchus laevis]|nr:hypothetical protein GJ496_005018 [Pomphorhynchus laevis]
MSADRRHCKSRKVKKTRKLRGHVSHGHGRVGKHRKHPGGRGNAGALTHHRTYFDRFHPGYISKLGMRRIHMLKNHFWCPAINTNVLWSLVPDHVRLQAKQITDSAPVIDVTKHGYSKVLAKGALPNQPIIVKARLFSKHAEQKIKKVGGACILVA